MTNALIPTEQNTDIITFDEEKIGLIKRTIAKGATDDELSLFIHQCQKTGLDPLAKQIYFQKYNTKNGPQIAIITGIDGYRLVAARTGSYAGNDEPVFDGRQNYSGVDVPVKASVTVWKIVAGHRVPFSASVYWNEYVPPHGKDFQWKKMPHVMLAKCAEAAALRKAFPADLSGVYTHEEMQQDNRMQVAFVDNDTREISDKSMALVEGEFNEVEETAVTVSPPPPEPQTDDDPDWLASAIACVDFTGFAEAIAKANVGYKSKEAVVGACKNKWSDDHNGEKFIFPTRDKNKRVELRQWLVERKQ